MGRGSHGEEVWCLDPRRTFLRVAFDNRGDLDRHEVDDLSRCVSSKGCEERLDVGFVALRRDDHDFF